MYVCCRPTPKWGDKVKNRQSYILVMVKYSLHNTEIYKVINNHKLTKNVLILLNWNSSALLIIHDSKVQRVFPTVPPCGSNWCLVVSLSILHFDNQSIGEVQGNCKGSEKDSLNLYNCIRRIISISSDWSQQGSFG